MMGLHPAVLAARPQGGLIRQREGNTAKSCLVDIPVDILFPVYTDTKLFGWWSQIYQPDYTNKWWE